MVNEIKKIKGYWQDAVARGPIPHYDLQDHSYRSSNKR